MVTVGLGPEDPNDDDDNRRPQANANAQRKGAAKKPPSSTGRRTVCKEFKQKSLKEVPVQASVTSVAHVEGSLAIFGFCFSSDYTVTTPRTATCTSGCKLATIRSWVLRKQRKAAASWCSGPSRLLLGARRPTSFQGRDLRPTHAFLE